MKRDLYIKLAAIITTFILIVSVINISAAADNGYDLPFIPVGPSAGNSGFIPGDVNGDKSADNKDVVILFRYVSGAKVEVNVKALDINGDGYVNNKDVVILFRYVTYENVLISDKPYTP